MVEGRFQDAVTLLETLSTHRADMSNSIYIDWLANLGSMTLTLSPADSAGCVMLEEAVNLIDDTTEPRLHISSVSLFVPCIVADFSRRADLFRLLGDAISVANDPSVDNASNILLLGALADAYLTSDRIEQGMRSLDQAYELSKIEGVGIEMFNIQFNKALASFFARQPETMDEAIQELGRIAEAHDDIVDGEFFVSYLRGLLNSPLLLNQPREAIQHLERAALLSDTTEEAFFAMDASITLLFLYLYQGETDLAGRLYGEIVVAWGEEALEYDPFIQAARAAQSGDVKGSIDLMIEVIGYHIDRSLDIARYAGVDRNATGETWVGEAYQAEIARQQSQIERLSMDRIKAESEVMRTRQYVIFSVAVLLFMSVVYLLVSRNRFKKLSLTDSLTSLPNRRRAYTAIEEALSLTLEGRINESEERGIGILLLDVDHFKLINDLYGHDHGDNVLKTIAEIISQSVQLRDLPARFGGEEFLVVLPSTTPQSAFDTAERIRLCVDRHNFGLPNDETVSLSVGVHVELKPTEPVDKVRSVDSDTLTKAADQALYLAKSSGRNCVKTSIDVRELGSASKNVRRARRAAPDSIITA